jgi:hypothetical protein
MNLELYDVCDLEVERYEYNRQEMIFCGTEPSSVKQEPALEGLGFTFSLPGSFYENMVRLKLGKTQNLEALAMDEFSWNFR